jgi:hypothetical protein
LGGAIIPSVSEAEVRTNLVDLFNKQLLIHHLPFTLILKS